MREHDYTKQSSDCEHNHTKQFIDYHKSAVVDNDFTIKVVTWYCTDCLQLMSSHYKRVVYIVCKEDRTELFGVHNLQADAEDQARFLGVTWKEAELWVG